MYPPYTSDLKVDHLQFENVACLLMERFYMLQM